MLATLRLGAGDADADALWRGVDVTGVAELAAYERSAIWLYRRLRAGRGFDALPEALRAPLRQAAMAEAVLRLRVESEAAAVLPLLGDAGIPVVLIKGIARCALAERYPYLDARPTSDVDLLVPGSRLAAAVETLSRAGYTPGRGSSDHHHAPGMHRNGVWVELHSSTSRHVSADVAWSRMAGSSDTVPWTGTEVQVPGVTELVWSALAHALEDEVEGFRLGRFLEVSALMAHHAEIDWPTVSNRLETAEGSAAVPAGVSGGAVARRWLGCASELLATEQRAPSGSIEPFPLAQLLEWRLALLRRRRWLGRAGTERLLEEGGRAMIGLPLQPALAGTPWYPRARRRAAGFGGRVAFATWRVVRTP